MKNTLLCSFLIISINLTAQVPSYVPQDSLVGWWPFNGNANDESGNSHNGMVNGAILVDDRLGNNSSAYSFDGSNDHISCPNLNQLNNCNQFSFSFWVNRNANCEQYARLIGQSSYTNQQSYSTRIQLSGTTLQPSVRNGANTYAYGGSLMDGSWHHVVMVFDGNGTSNNEKVKLYVNNSLTILGFPNGLDSIPDLTYSGTDLFYIGWDTAMNVVNGHFGGSLDDIGVWNRALDSCEIKDLYHSNSSCTNGIKDLDNLSVNLYPNPTNGWVTLSLSNTTKGQVILTDLLGKEVLSKRFTSNEVQLNLKSLESKGAYFAKVLDADGNVIAIKKLIYQ